MKRRCLLASVIVVVVVSGGLFAPAAAVEASPLLALPPVDVLGLTASGTGLLVLSTPTAPGPLQNLPPLADRSVRRTISGLSAGEFLHGIDVRPATGQLFGLGSTSRLYTIDPSSGVAKAVGLPFSPRLSGDRFGFDFNPVADRIRVTSSTGQNLRLDPVTGGVAGVDSPLDGATSSVEASAYTSSAGVATSTTLYDISVTTARLSIQDPPSSGTLKVVGPLGVDLVPGAPIGFDILSSGTSNKALASLTVLTPSRLMLDLVARPGLYEIDLATGAATLLGTTGEVLGGIAIAGPAGYCGADASGQVDCRGAAGGARPPIPGLAREIVDAVPSPSGQGVWQVARDGGVFTSGDADFFGSTGGIRLAAEVAGMAPTPSGLGYWLVAADGGVFTYGDAGFFGAVPGLLAPGQPLAKPVVGIVGTPTGRGYWIVAEDGGIFAFGDATFLGSVPAAMPPGRSLGDPVVGIARNESGAGYYVAAADGGVFAFGAPFLGSASGIALAAAVTDVASAGASGGYRLFAADGGIFNYGASFRGPVDNMDPGVGLAG